MLPLIFLRASAWLMSAISETFDYSKEIIENTRAHRLNIVKNYSDYRTLNALNSSSLRKEPEQEQKLTLEQVDIRLRRVEKMLFNEEAKQ